MIVCLGVNDFAKTRQSKFGWFMHERGKDITKATHQFLMSRRASFYTPGTTDDAFRCWYICEDRNEIPIWLLDSLNIKGHAFRSIGKANKEEEKKEVRNKYKWDQVSGNALVGAEPPRRLPSDFENTFLQPAQQYKGFNWQEHRIQEEMDNRLRAIHEEMNDQYENGVLYPKLPEEDFRLLGTAIGIAVPEYPKSIP